VVVYQKYLDTRMRGYRIKRARRVTESLIASCAADNARCSGSATGKTPHNRKPRNELSLIQIMCPKVLCRAIKYNIQTTAVQDAI